MCKATGSMRGLVYSGGLVGSSYCSVSGGMYVMTCVSAYGPMSGVRL